MVQLSKINSWTYNLVKSQLRFLNIGEFNNVKIKLKSVGVRNKICEYKSSEIICSAFIKLSMLVKLYVPH